MSQPPSGQDPHGPGSTGQPPGQGGWGQPQGQGGWGQPPEGQGAAPGQPPGQYGQPGQFGQPGPYGQPGQPGQYGQPGPYGQPGQYGPPGQYGQPGSYGQPGQYGQPGPYGQPGQGPARSKRGLVIGLVAGLVALIALAVVLVVVLGGDDDPAPAASGSSSASSSSASSSSSSRSTTSSPPPPTASAPAPAGDLLSILPTDFTDCTESPLGGDGDVAHATCGASTTQPGPVTAEFYQYPDQALLDSTFTNEVSGLGLGDIPAGEDCSTTPGIGPWNAGANTGLVACTIDTANGAVVIAWTDDAALVQGFVAAPGATQADLATLYDWWRNHSDYVL
ncbi:collagen-like protein [Geodermatophilus sabuli]|uniref:Collagen-like protein n=1 Tax=Geodermatophilus sabuli TaxID=1564158 RepID=A0A7K3VXB4_9ACTN|nr:collagen-like protein [Geodermatophilus sabuli]NEK57289.1 collagen-like protein [Geodermatophilus sabuli]